MWWGDGFTRNTTRTIVRILLVLLAIYAVRTAMRRRHSVL